MKLTKKLFLSMGILPGVLDHLNDGINVVDTEGILIYVNEISAKYVNKTRSSMLGRSITEFYPDAVLLAVLQNRQPILDKKIHFVPPKNIFIRYIIRS